MSKRIALICLLALPLCAQDKPAPQSPTIPAPVSQPASKPDQISVLKLEIRLVKQQAKLQTKAQVDQLKLQIFQREVDVKLAAARAKAAK
jgi:hypothetical protein